MNLNKVFILGRLTADPQAKSLPSGTQVATFSVATNRLWNDKTGNRQTQTEFHNIVVWGRQAEIASQFLKKGGLVLVEGRLQTREWQDKQGQNRRTTEIVAERIQLGPRPLGRSSKMEEAAQGGESQEVPTIDLEAEKDIKVEDLPF